MAAQVADYLPKPRVSIDGFNHGYEWLIEQPAFEVLVVREAGNELEQRSLQAIAVLPRSL